MGEGGVHQPVCLLSCQPVSLPAYLPACLPHCLRASLPGGSNVLYLAKAMRPGSSTGGGVMRMT